MKFLSFFQEVRVEASKVVWPVPKETATIVALVLGVVAIAALFFLMIDSLVYKFVQLVLGI